MNKVSPYAVVGLGRHPEGTRPPPESSLFPCGGVAASAAREKKGDWRAYSPPSLPHSPYLRKVSKVLYSG